VLRNKVDDDAVFSGVDGPRCPRAPANSPPRGLLINKGSASGVFQDDFKNGEVQHSESVAVIRHGQVTGGLLGRLARGTSQGLS
jgi:hypothetical protein